MVLVALLGVWVEVGFQHVLLKLEAEPVKTVKESLKRQPEVLPLTVSISQFTLVSPFGLFDLVQ
jgi:hypothetical protein